MRIDTSSTALFLDVDGTLLDIAPKPGAVSVPVSLVEALSRLAARLDGALALVSGRRIVDLDALFAPLRLAAAGAHGGELRARPEGDVAFVPGAELPSELRARLHALARALPGVIAEDKMVSVAMHYRQAPERFRELESRIRELVERHDPGAVILEGKAVFEVKRPGYDKGSAIRALLEHAPFAGRRPMFAGDDVTDEAGFRVVRALGGEPLLVGRDLPDLARAFDQPAEVRAWIVAEAGAGDLDRGGEQA